MAPFDVAMNEPIAIVGLACRFPGASDADAYWRLLEEGRDAITEVPASRWDMGALYDAVPGKVGKISSRFGGFLDEVDRFDAAFFGITPREARAMDPQQRLVLEIAWEALEDAGVTPSLAGSRTGVFLGATTWDYNKIANTDVRYMEAHASTGTVLCILANRLSYLLNLRGPSMVVDTACSSSLTAVHLACASLRSGESDLALAGGINLILSPETSIVLSQAKMLSPDGRCKAFDERANGYVRSEGCGVVVLERASDALEKGDRILAFIRGTAINQDGLSNGLSAPNGLAQQDVIRAALANARVSGHAIGYVETHGTGTALGDPIEIAAIAAVLGAGRPAERACGLGSVKTNIGHTEAAAGIAGLIKVVLSMQHGRIPRHIHLETLSPKVGALIDGTPFYIPTEGAPWATDGAPRLASVSSFGFGGANAHVVLEENVCEAAPSRAANRVSILPLSAKDPRALRELAARYANFLRSTAEEAAPSLVDVAFTAGARRVHHGHRVAVTAHSKVEAAEALAAFAANGAFGRPALRRPKVVFVFSGQGSQWPRMGSALLEREPVFRETIARCAEAMKGYLDAPLADLLSNEPSEASSRDPALVQPMLFAMQLGLAALWASWGVKPDTVVGHSMGEVAAACVAGALSLEDAVRVICLRSRLVGRTSRAGGMLSVELPRAEVEAQLERYEGRLSVAASNGPTTTIVSGDRAAITELHGHLERRDVFARPVKVEFASHSAHMDPIRAELLAELAPIRPVPPAVRFASTALLGGDAPRLDAAYWWTNLRHPVLFAERVGELRKSGFETYVEISPHPVLTASLKATLQHAPHATVVGSLRRDEDPQRCLLESLGALYARGVPVPFGVFAPPAPRVLSLPSYPWQRERFWLEGGGTDRMETGSPLPRGGRHIEVSDRPGMHIWEFGLDPERAPELRDHRVSGRAIASASYMVEKALSAASSSFGTDTWDIAQWRFSSALDVEAAKTLQIVLTSNDAGDIACTMASPSAEGRWVHHATAILRPARAREGDGSVVLVAIHASCTEMWSGDAFYQRLADHGVEMAASCRVLEVIGRRDGEALAKLVGAPSVDAAVQTLGAAVRTQGVEKAMYVPVAIASMGPLPREASFAHAVLSDGGGADVVGDVAWLDEAGRVLGEIVGIRLQRAAATTREHADLFDMTWVRDEAPSISLPPGSWLVLGDGEPSDVLAGKIRAAGDRCIRVRRAAAYTSVERDLHGVNPDNPDDMARLLREVTAEPALPPLVAIVDLWASREGCGAALHLVQAAAAVEWNEPPRIWFVTHGASGDAGAEQASLWGLGLTAARELPEFRCTLLDVESPSDAACLYDEVVRNAGEDRLALRGGVPFVARLRRFSPEDHAAPEPAGILADGTYVLSGGLGGLGLLVARWLVDRGAQNLVLLGRRPPTETAEAAIGALRDRGARIRVAAVDVSDRSAVERLFAHVHAELSPVRGVFHLAATLDDGTLLRLTAQHFSGPSFTSKVVGAWNLHLVTQGLKLDHFVLFSSAASVFGAPGMATYAAANAALDGLARTRRGLGLPAVSIQWGPWAGQGFAAAEHREDRLAAQGVGSLSPAEALERLGAILNTRASNVMAARIGGRPAAMRGPLARFLEDLDGTRAADARAQAQRPIADIADIEPRLCERVAKITGLDPSRVPRHESFHALGMDSLLLLELRNGIEADFGLYVPIALLARYPSVESLKGYLWTKIRSSVSRPARAASPRLVRAVPRPNARLRLICFPAAGESALSFEPWHAALPDWVDVCAIPRESSCTSMDAWIDGIMADLAGELDRPFALFGTSLGALVAYETALRIQRERGVWPEKFLVAAFPSPAAVQRLKSNFDERQWLHFLVPEAAHRADETLSALRADIHVGFRWNRETLPSLGCPIVAFEGTDDPIAGGALDGWRAFSGGPFVHKRITGGHMFTQTHEREFLSSLRAEIETWEKK